MLSPCILHPTTGDESRHPRTKLNGKSIGLTRIVYAKANNVSIESLAGLVIMHKCDTPRCINPEHLVAGTQADNIDDMWRKGRQGVKPMQGVKHPLALLTEDMVRSIRDNYWISGKAMAAKYQVSTATVSMIRTGKIWKHLIQA